MTNNPRFLILIILITLMGTACSPGLGVREIDSPTVGLDAVNAPSAEVEVLTPDLVISATSNAQLMDATLGADLKIEGENQNRSLGMHADGHAGGHADGHAGGHADAPEATNTPSGTAVPPDLETSAPVADITKIFPTPTATLHPMNILAARQTPYPGSEIVIEETLEPGLNYFRYYASYLSEGLKIYGLLTVPYAEQPASGYPAIVFNHGYIPPDVYRTTERYIAYVDTLARNGYIVFRIDYRGHDRSEGEASGAYGDPGYLVDVMNAVAALQRHPQVDPERIGMWGHSMGGYLTLRAMVISPEIKAGVIWAGVVASYADLLCCWRRGDPGQPTPTPNPNFARRWRQAWTELYGTPEENPEFWAGISANSYLADLSGPMQLHHGTADEDVPLQFSQTLYNQLLEAGKTAEYYEYPGDNHNISLYFTLAMTRTVEFFDLYLKGAP
jgi:dienelactone hydrolase